MRVKLSLISFTAVLLSGCDSDYFSETVASISKVPTPTTWSFADGQKIDLGHGEVVSIIGSNTCSTGLDEYPCWKFSLKNGDKQVVYLSNGMREEWETVSVGNNRVSLVRPNGTQVVRVE